MDVSSKVEVVWADNSKTIILPQVRCCSQPVAALQVLVSNAGCKGSRTVRESCSMYYCLPMPVGLPTSGSTQKSSLIFRMTDQLISQHGF